MEEWRAVIVDATVMSMINGHEILKDDFVIDIETYGKMIKKPKFVEKTDEEFINGIKDYQISYDLKLLLIIIHINNYHVFNVYF